MKKLLTGLMLLSATASFADVCSLSNYASMSDFKGLEARYKCVAEKSINHTEERCFFSSEDNVVHRFKTLVYGIDSAGVIGHSSLFDLSRYSNVVGKFEIVDNDDVYEIKRFHSGSSMPYKTFSIDKATLEATEVRTVRGEDKTTAYNCEEV